MRDIAKEVITMLLDYSILTFWGVVVGVTTIMTLSIFFAWKNRFKADFYFGEVKGKGKVDGTRVPLRQLDYFVDVYARKLVQGFILSILLITLVLLPLILVRWAS